MTENIIFCTGDGENVISDTGSLKYPPKYKRRVLLTDCVKKKKKHVAASTFTQELYKIIHSKGF